MHVEQATLSTSGAWDSPPVGQADAALALVFGGSAALKRPDLIDAIRDVYPRATLFGCSTAGQILNTSVTDESLTVSAVAFRNAGVRSGHTCVEGVEDSFAAGTRLAGLLDPVGLVHVFVLSDGLNVNGSDLVKGITAELPSGVTVSGGLAGDGERFRETVVLADGVALSKTVGVVGLYGAGLRVACASVGGWDPFGPDRLITRSRRNVLYELDGCSALDLYKTYLGEHAAGLPATGLLFPLSLRGADSERRVVRTILSVDEAEHSLTFAGDVPEGSYARLMKANFDRLIDGAADAAKNCVVTSGAATAELAVLISCVGRRMVLKQRIEEEVEGVRDVLGRAAKLTGFYSYGEISPFGSGASCELHNQTMTITTLAEC